MPYIEHKDRAALLTGEVQPDSPGELNYCISVLVHEYLKSKSVNYTRINEVIGILECAKLELYRQLAAPYEDKKKAENGPVSGLDR